MDINDTAQENRLVLTGPHSAASGRGSSHRDAIMTFKILQDSLQIPRRTSGFHSFRYSFRCTVKCLDSWGESPPTGRSDVIQRALDIGEP